LELGAAVTSKHDLEEDYANAGFGGVLPFGKRPALLIIDVVMAYLDKQSPLYAGVEDALAANERMLAAFRKAGRPVIFTNVLYQAGGLDGGMFFKKVPALKAYLPGSPYIEFPPTLQPIEGELVISKQYPSAFFGTSLASTLNAARVDTVVIGGFSTSGCVRASALDAVQHGFAPFVVREACGERDPRPHEANLFDIQAKIGEVVSESDVVSWLQ
jgi:maleamate amidohydrolase